MYNFMDFLGNNFHKTFTIMMRMIEIVILMMRGKATMMIVDHHPHNHHRHHDHDHDHGHHGHHHDHGVGKAAASL